MYYREVENQIRKAEQINKNAETIIRQPTEEERQNYLSVLQNQHNYKGYLQSSVKSPLL